jgi:hypothetical protein
MYWYDIQMTINQTLEDLLPLLRGWTDEDESDDTDLDTEDSDDDDEEPTPVLKRPNPAPKTPGTAVRNPDELLNRFNQTKQELKEFKARQKALVAAGISAEDISALVKFKQEQETAKRTAEETDLETKKQYAALFDKKAADLEAEKNKVVTQLTKRNEALAKQVEELTGKINEGENQRRTMGLKTATMQAFYAADGLKGGGEDDEDESDQVFNMFWATYGDRISQGESGIEILDKSGKNIAVDSEGKALSLVGYVNKIKSSSSGKTLFSGLRPSGNDTKPSTSQPKVSSTNASPRIIKSSDMVRLAELKISLDDITQGRVIVRG